MKPITPGVRRALRRAKARADAGITSLSQAGIEQLEIMATLCPEPQVLQPLIAALKAFDGGDEAPLKEWCARLSPEDIGRLRQLGRELGCDAA